MTLLIVNDDYLSNLVLVQTLLSTILVLDRHLVIENLALRQQLSILRR